MENVFIIHRSKDAPKAEQLIASFAQEKDIAFLLLNGKRHFWKKEAKQKIIQSDVVIYLAGAETSPNIAWELKQAKKAMRLVYAIKLNKDCLYDQAAYVQDGFTSAKEQQGNQYPYVKEIDVSALKEALTLSRDEVIDRQLKNANIVDSGFTARSEQYKAYLATSEAVLNRRQETSSFYISLCSVLLAITSGADSLIASLVSDRPTMLTCLLSITSVLCLIGIYLSLNWRRLLKSYGSLNSAKMKVINALEKQLPFNIYSTEWMVMSQKAGKGKYRSFTETEMKVPFAFLLAFSAVEIAAVVVFIVLYVQSH
jgi:hypothetical protein